MTDTTGGSGDPNPDPAGSEGTPAPQIPEGYVPRSELEREQLRARGLQSEKDRLAAQLAESSRTPAGEGEGASSGFDPDEFRRQVIRETLHAGSLQREADRLRTEYPHADESLFEADRLTGFGSVEALRLAAQDSHQRVARAIEASKADLRKQIEEELRNGGKPLPPNDPSGSTLGTGDPTPEQLSRMTSEEWDELEKRSPGVIQRVLRAAS